MNDTPTENVKLTFDQLQAIDVAQKRLAVLESEVVNATKVLKGTKMEADRATKENAYQNELLATVTTQVNDKKLELFKLDENILEKTAQLNQLLTEFKEHTDKMTDERMAMKDREDKISVKEKETHEREVKILNTRDDLNNDLRNFKEKVAKLKEVISTF